MASVGGVGLREAAITNSGNTASLPYIDSCAVAWLRSISGSCGLLTLVSSSAICLTLSTVALRSCTTVCRSFSAWSMRPVSTKPKMVMTSVCASDSSVLKDAMRTGDGAGGGGGGAGGRATRNLASMGRNLVLNAAAGIMRRADEQGGRHARCRPAAQVPSKFRRA